MQDNSPEQIISADAESPRQLTGEEINEVAGGPAIENDTTGP